MSDQLQHVSDSSAVERMMRFVQSCRDQKPEPPVPASVVDQWDDELKALDARMLGRERDRQLERARNLSEINPFFAERVFTNFRISLANQEAYDRAVIVAEDPTSRGLGIYGFFGNGKSHLAAAIVNDAIAKGIPAVFITTAALMERLRVSNKRGAIEDEAELIASYANVPVLVLDDVGKERLTDWGATTLFSLINARYEAKRPLIVTANADWNDLGQTKYALLHEQRGGEGIDPALGPAIMDRIREMTGPWVRNDAPSERGTKR